MSIMSMKNLFYKSSSKRSKTCHQFMMCEGETSQIDLIVSYVEGSCIDILPDILEVRLQLFVTYFFISFIVKLSSLICDPNVFLKETENHSNILVYVATFYPEKGDKCSHVLSHMS
ncbi:CLUMA_CG006773, isoform A [Clunio marinus]|uniref:CLUMA_CG006773, isoform A n=1 Tax=Clunio marinus TaxID=568069 RepID=A0A1J1HYX4_9DIPT|nr:CLUMA_CG006773, isoform A [Clunio marinus]